MKKLFYEVKTNNASRVTDLSSQAVRAGDFLYISGQTGVDLKTGKLVGGLIEEHTEQALKNIKAILATQHVKSSPDDHIGEPAGLDRVVSCTVLLGVGALVTNVEYMAGCYEKMDKVYKLHFTGNVKPAREVALVSDLLENSLVQISCIAYLGFING